MKCHFLSLFFQCNVFLVGTTSTSAPTESLVDGRPNSGTEEEMGCSKVCCRTRLAQTGWRGAVTASRFACFRNIKLKTEFQIYKKVYNDKSDAIINRTWCGDETAINLSAKAYTVHLRLKRRAGVCCRGEGLVEMKKSKA